MSGARQLRAAPAGERSVLHLRRRAPMDVVGGAGGRGSSVWISFNWFAPAKPSGVGQTAEALELAICMSIEF